MADYHMDEDDCESFHFDGQAYLFEYADLGAKSKSREEPEKQQEKQFCCRERDLLLPDLENRCVHGWD